MQENISISAIIPTFNRANSVVRAIESAICQEFTPKEIIVVDDGSTDNTQSIVEQYGTRIQYIKQKNKGVSATRNRGVKEARYEWIAFLDSDDYWLKDHLRKIAKAIDETQAKASLYFSDLEWPTEKGHISYWEKSNFSIQGEWEISENAVNWAMMKTQPMMLQASVIKRKTYLDLGGLPDYMLTREDTLLFHKLCMSAPVCAVLGVGTVMAGDMGKSDRLTEIYHGNSLVYWQCTETLYKELLKFINKTSENTKEEIIERLVKAKLGLSRVYFRKKQLIKMFTTLTSGFLVSPKFLAINIFKILDRHCFK